MTAEFYKKHYRKSGKMRKARLICKKCGRRVSIDTLDKKLYTKEFRGNYICMFCR